MCSETKRDFGVDGSLDLGVEPVAKKKWKTNIGWSCRSIGSGHLETSQPAVVIIKEGKVQGEFGMWLNSVAQLIGHQHLRLEAGIAVGRRDSRERRKERG